MEDDFTTWRDINEKTSTNVMITRCKLFYAHVKKIRCRRQGDRWVYTPMMPVNLYKNHHQIRYNKGKPGFDKTKEVGCRIILYTPTIFETTYVLTCFDRILVNYYGAEIAVAIMNTWMLSLEHKQKLRPSMNQIGKKMKI